MGNQHMNTTEANVRPAAECAWCDEPSTELRIWTGGGWVKDLICAACFARADGENSFANLATAPMPTRRATDHQTPADRMAPLAALLLRDPNTAIPGLVAAIRAAKDPQAAVVIATIFAKEADK